MEKLTLLDAKEIEFKYGFLTVFTVGGFKVKTVIKQPHDEDNSAFKVIVVIETSNILNDRFENLDEFCNNHNLPYPELSL